MVLEVQKAYAQLIRVLFFVHFSETHVKTLRKQKEEVVFYWMGTVPSFSVNCSMEFLFGQKMELIFWKVYQRSSTGTCIV